MAAVSIVAEHGRYQASAGDLVLADASSGVVTVIVPVGAEDTVTVKKSDSSANLVLVMPAFGLIDGATSLSVSTQWQSVTCIADGANVWVI